MSIKVRADHIGSLLRAPEIIAARDQFDRGELSASKLKSIEDQAIAKVIQKQESIDLHVVTDGEFRRSMFHLDFLENLDGIESYRVARGVEFHKGVAAQPQFLRVHDKIGFSSHPMLEQFAFTKNHTSATAKATIPTPSMLVPAHRDWSQDIDRKVYPDLQQMYEDLGAAYNKALRAFAKAGCRYLQMDEVNLTFLCDPAFHDRVRQAGRDPEKMKSVYAALINAAVANVPATMEIAIHFCRGNVRSSWLASGGYEPIAELIFNDLNVNTYLLEYDSDRAGDFEPLRHLPKNKNVVLGLLSSKLGELESKDGLRRRIDQATKYVDLDRLALSPQCGFATTVAGNILTEDQQWRKLELVVELAEEIWGTA